MIFSANSTLGEKLGALTLLGLNTVESPDVVAELSRLVLDTSQDHPVRGYAAWALDRIRPRSESESGGTYHVSVDHPAASDDNPGDGNRPWKTIQKAAETMRAGDTAIIHGGVYRECIRPFHGGTSSQRMISYQAAPGESPIIKAMDVWTPLWKEEGDGLRSAPYTPHAWDPPRQPAGDNPKARCEQVFVNGALLKHVEHKEECVRTANTMWIDNETTRIWINTGVDPSTLVVERSIRQQCFVPAVRGLGYIRVRGLTMLGGAAHIWTGGNWHHINQMSVLAVNGGHHWIIEDNTIEWGGAQGLSLGIGGFATPMKDLPLINHPLDDQDMWKTFPGVCGGHVARRNRVNHHAISGIVAIGDAVDLLIEDNEVIDNNLKDCRGTCEEAGIKIHAMKNGIIRRNVVRDNLSFGIWLDADCQCNRVTQNILIDNADHHIFHEISPGPLLVDTNVIQGTRAGSTNAGFYTHDGNRSVVINNVILDCTLGVRVRALFHRKFFDEYTTTSHNHFYNNIIDRCPEGAVSLMPDVPRCEDNRSEANVLWSSGAPVFTRMENTSDVGMVWESSELGKALGFSGGGNRVIPLEAWAQYLKRDTTSPVCPSRLILGTEDPAAILDMLVRVARDRGIDLDRGYYEPKPFDPMTFAQSNPALGPGCRLVRTMWTGPRAGIQVWETSRGAMQVLWEGDAVTTPEPLKFGALLNEPVIAPVAEIKLALGESFQTSLDSAWIVASAGIPADVKALELSVTAPPDASPGGYSLILATPKSWAVVPVTISQACTLDDFWAEITGGTAVIGRITNGTGAVLSGRVEVSLCKESTGTDITLAPRQTGYFRVPVQCIDAGEATVTVRLGGSTLQRKKLLSFATAQRLNSWEKAPRYDLDNFPGGAFPEGVWAIKLYQDTLHAWWRVRYDDTGLHVRVEVDHPIHLADRLDMEGIHCGDGVKIGVKGKPGDRATVVGMALMSETSEQTFGFCKSANEKKYPVDRYPQMKASVTREGKRTTYEALIEWDMINLQGPPKAGSSIPFSIVVFCRDPDMSYGLQWFFGILYDSREGDESWMGRLWFE